MSHEQNGRWGPRVVIERSRADFEREVIKWREHIARHGWIETPDGRRLRVPVQLEDKERRPKR